MLTHQQNLNKLPVDVTKKKILVEVRILTHISIPVYVFLAYGGWYVIHI